MKKQVFLGGTCGNNKWRKEKFIPELMKKGVSSDKFFDPVVADWTPACMAAEDEAKKESQYMLYYISDPKQEGNTLSAYSLVEAIMGLYDDPDRTVVVIDTTYLPEKHHSMKALSKTLKDLKTRFPKGMILDDLDAVIDWFGKKLK